MSDLKQEFLLKVKPWAQLVQRYVTGKCQFRGIESRHGIFASLVAADILVSSEWGTHAVSRPEYDGRPGNNLNLLESFKGYPGKSIVFDGVSYRSYKTWHEFVVDYSDHLVYSDQYLNVLKASTVEEQVLSFSTKKLDKRVYNGRVSAMIDFYNLSELDNGSEART